MEVGIASKNTLRYIHVNAIYDVLDDKVCKALPAFHAFTGSDYAAAFCRRGKIKPFRLFLKDQAIIDTFEKLGDLSYEKPNHITQEEFKNIESSI